MSAAPSIPASAERPPGQRRLGSTRIDAHELAQELTHRPRPAAVRHRRFGRRRQVHPGRAGCCTTPSRCCPTQLDAVQRTSEARGLDTVDLSLLVDGLRAEREQGITIDVAYRYFATPARTFILADTPGHVQYTRNTVTGASTADLVVILTDARTGVVEQTRRHAAVAALLGVPHLLLAVNKIDLVDYDQQVFDAIAAEFSAYAKELGIHEVTAIPISALHGDNVVTRSERIGWYTGRSVLEHLETVDLTDDSADGSLRFPVQYVIRPRSDELPDYRGYAGRVAAGTVRPGDEIVALPSGLRSTVDRASTPPTVSGMSPSPGSR